MPNTGSSLRRTSVNCFPFPKARPSHAAHGGDLLAAMVAEAGGRIPSGKGERKNFTR